MPDVLPPLMQPDPPRALVTTRMRSQLENFLVLRRNPLELWGKGAYEQDILPGRFLGREQIMLNDPDAIRHVLVGNPDNYRRNVGTLRVLQPVIGSGLFLAEGEAWRHQRRTIAPAFTPRTMAMLARHVAVASAAKEAELDALAGKPVLLLPHLQSLALSIAAQSMFSLEAAGFAAEMRGMLFDYARRWAQPGFLDLLLPRNMSTPLDVGRAAFRKRWLRLIDRIIDTRLQSPSDAEQPRDLFDLLAAARDPSSGAGFSRAQLRDEVATMILAGHETTAVALFWSCFMAATRPGQQAALAAEATGIDLSPSRAGEAMRQLPLARAHIDETLRLYPPAFLIVREAIATDRVGGRNIGPGTVVSISPWVIHRHRRLWDNPDGFDPARFLPGAPPPPRFAYLPFGAGPRICVGMQFALTEATLVLARLLSRFRLDIIGGRDVTPRGFVTTQPDRPVRFVITRRAS